MIGAKKSLLTTMLIAATVLTLLALILSIASIARQRWVSYEPASISSNPRTRTAYPRYRGVFWECLKDEDDAKAFRPPDQCVLLDRGWNHPNTTNEDYWHIINLRRAHAAMLILGILGLFLALFLLIAALAMTVSNKNFGSRQHKTFIKFALAVLIFCILCFLATFFIFHVLMDQEKYLATGNLLPETYSHWDHTVYTFIRFASSYILLWVALLLTMLAALLPMLLLCWGFSRIFGHTTTRVVEEKLVATGPGAVQVTSSQVTEAVRTHPGDTTAPYSYTGISSTNAY